MRCYVCATNYDSWIWACRNSQQGRVYAKNALRATIFMPYVSNIVAVAVIFKVLLGQQQPDYPAAAVMGI